MVCRVLVRKGWTCLIQTHPSLFLRLLASLCIVKLGGKAQFLARRVLNAVLLASFFSLILVLLTVLAFTLGALSATIFVTDSGLVH